jgi:hypothetical protein
MAVQMGRSHPFAGNNPRQGETIFHPPRQELERAKLPFRPSLAFALPMHGAKSVTALASAAAPPRAGPGVKPGGRNPLRGLRVL